MVPLAHDVRTYFAVAPAQAGSQTGLPKGRGLDPGLRQDDERGEALARTLALQSRLDAAVTDGGGWPLA